MPRIGRAILLAGLVASLLVVPSPEPALGQARVCLTESGGTLPASIDLGTPGEQGVTQQPRLNSPEEILAFKFRVPDGGAKAVYVYVGDQWFDIDLALYSVTDNRAVACWQTTGARARSERSAVRQIQLIRPDEQIIETLQPGDYVLLVGMEALLPGFDPSKGFTVRVAIGPEVCALNPGNVPHPVYPGLKMRADDAWYQLGVTAIPHQPGPFDLVTFNAFLSPPYSDLFDFEWELDGNRMADATGPVVQVPVPALEKTALGIHKIKATARGVREYPDPEQTHMPPTLTTECVFTVKS
jgi:hypothetical protein